MAFAILIPAFMGLSIFLIWGDELKDGAELMDNPRLRDSSTPTMAKTLPFFSIFCSCKIINTVAA